MLITLNSVRTKLAKAAPGDHSGTYWLKDLPIDTIGSVSELNAFVPQYTTEELTQEYEATEMVIVVLCPRCGHKHSTTWHKITRKKFCRTKDCLYQDLSTPPRADYWDICIELLRDSMQVLTKFTPNFWWSGTVFVRRCTTQCGRFEVKPIYSTASCTRHICPTIQPARCDPVVERALIDQLSSAPVEHYLPILEKATGFKCVSRAGRSSQWGTRWSALCPEGHIVCFISLNELMLQFQQSSLACDQCGYLDAKAKLLKKLRISESEVLNIDVGGGLTSISVEHTCRNGHRCWNSNDAIWCYSCFPMCWKYGYIVMREGITEWLETEGMEPIAINAFGVVARPISSGEMVAVRLNDIGKEKDKVEWCTSMAGWDMGGLVPTRVERAEQIELSESDDEEEKE